jgi:hypothetical protein
MIITNSTPDEYYFNQLIAFLMSIKINSPKHVNQIKVFLANYQDETVDKLKIAFPEVEFENNPLKMIDKRGFATIIDRAYRVWDCLQTKEENVLWMDTDVIVRGDLSDLVRIKPKQLKILYRENAPDRIKINAGIFNIGHSKVCCKFIKDWHQGCVRNKKWGNGQLQLWKSFKKYKERIELTDITKKFNSVGRHFEDDYVVWHCKLSHFDNPIYQKEYQLYLTEGKKQLEIRK